MAIKYHTKNEFEVDNTDFINDIKKLKIDELLNDESPEKSLSWIIDNCCAHFINLPEWFMDKWVDRLDWFDISVYQKLSENFIRRHKGKLSNYLLTQYQKLSPKLIKELGILPDEPLLKTNFLMSDRKSIIKSELSIDNETNWDDFIIRFIPTDSNDYVTLEDNELLNSKFRKIKLEIGKESKIDDRLTDRLSIDYYSPSFINSNIEKSKHDYRIENYSFGFLSKIYYEDIVSVGGARKITPIKKIHNKRFN